MALIRRKARHQALTFAKYDFKASITVFFVALPLCLGISLASGAPVYSGLISGIIGGVVVSLLSRSPLSVSGPAAGLTAICATAISDLGAIEVFFVSVSVAGLLQVALGAVRLGGFTHLIPSAVIKGMLAAIGIILISKQVPFLIGYDRPDFWTNELFNILTLDHAFSHIGNLYRNTSAAAILIALTSLGALVAWKRYAGHRLGFIPASFIAVATGLIMAWLFSRLVPELTLEPGQYVNIPSGLIQNIRYPDLASAWDNPGVWKYAIMICAVASLETLLSIEAIDRLDPLNRVTPRNRELMAQGAGNFLGGCIGAIPITAVIVRSSANAEAGARTRLSSVAHGVWILLAVLLAIPLVNLIPYCVLAVILIRTGYNLAKPRMILAIYRQGREQFLPFAVTVIAILFTDLLIGILIGIIYSIYFLIKHTYKAGFSLKERQGMEKRHFTIELDMNVSFLNKKRLIDTLDQIPEEAALEVIGSNSLYIDNDILEIIQDFKAKAAIRGIQLTLKDIREVQTIGLH